MTPTTAATWAGDLVVIAVMVVTVLVAGIVVWQLLALLRGRAGRR